MRGGVKNKRGRDADHATPIKRQKLEDGSAYRSTRSMFAGDIGSRMVVNEANLRCVHKSGVWISKRQLVSDDDLRVLVEELGTNLQPRGARQLRWFGANWKGHGQLEPTDPLPPRAQRIMDDLSVKTGFPRITVATLHQYDHNKAGKASEADLGPEFAGREIAIVPHTDDKLLTGNGGVLMLQVTNSADLCMVVRNRRKGEPASLTASTHRPKGSVVVCEGEAFQAPHQHAVLWDQKSKERFMMTLTVRSIPLPWSSNDNNSSSCTPAPRGLASRGARREENPRGPPVIEALPEQAPRLSWSPDRSESPDDRTNDYSPRNADIRAKPYATTRGAILDDDADMRGAQGRSDRNDRPRDTVVGRDSIRNIRNQRGNRDADQRNFPSGRSWDMDRDRGDFRDRVADRAPADANFGGRDHGRNMSRDADFRDRNVDRAPRDADFKGRDFARNDSRDADFKGGRNADRGPADGGIRGRGFDRNNSRDADFRGRGFDRNNSRDADFRGRGFDRNKDADFRGRGFDRNNSRDAGFKGGHGDGSSADAGFRGKGAVRDPAFRSSRDRDGGDRNWGRDTESRPDDLFQRDRRGRQDSPDTRAEKQDVDDRRDRLDSKDSRGRKNSVGSRREKPQENKKSKSREKVKEKKSEEKIREEKPKKRRKSSSSSESLRGESPPRRRGRSEGKRSKKGRRSVTDRSSTRSSSESSRSTSGSSTGSTSSSGTRSPTPMRVFSTAEISRMTVDEIKPLLEERKTAWKDFRATFEKYQSRPPTTLDLELRVYRHEKVLFEQCKLLQEAKTAIKEKEKAKKEKKDKKDKKDKKSKEPEKDEKKDKKDKKDKK
ncbi:hypothetical protein DIPPA_16780 [Diplonema papillatum]|nr:hypothetical protein DIPPA_16780 [Diplonema papillatum]